MVSSARIRLWVSIKTSLSTCCLKEGFAGDIDTPPRAFLARDPFTRKELPWTSEVETFSLFAFGYIVQKVRGLAKPVDQTNTL